MSKMVGKIFIGTCISLLAMMWVYALFFASKESVNQIADKAWQQRAEAICNTTAVARKELADYRLITEMGPDALAERADIVDKATAMLSEMVDKLSASTPTDAKGSELIPLWISDYRTYIGDRRMYSQILRTGVNDAFAETMVDGLPLSEKIATFAADNYMVSCKPPRDLSV
jgi:vacuolar-type H+-ATPase subunit H